MHTARKSPALEVGRGCAAALLASLIAPTFTACDALLELPVHKPPPTAKNGDPLTTALPSEARRLTQAELDRTLATLLLDDTGPAQRLLLTDTFTPFDNDYTTQQSSAALVDALDALAVDVAARALQSDAARAQIFVCTPSGDADAACFGQIVDALGRRLLRHPLPPEDVQGYVDALLPFASEDVEGHDSTFDDAVELAIRALLLEPETLFRIEVGTPTAETGVVALDDFEIASRMSFLLWGQAPDDALLDDAAAGQLTEAEARGAVAERMIGDDRAKAQLRRFHALWLGYRAIPVDPALASRMADETGAAIDRVIFDDRRDYLDLFTLDETFVDDELADHYGLPHPSTSPGWVPYGDTGRAGILSQGTVLSAFSKFTDTSPTQRGILVRSRLMCLPIASPPPTVMADQPPQEDFPCKAQRYAAHMATSGCTGCHTQMDPIGNGLEEYDIEGRFRTVEDDNADCPISGLGTLPGVGDFHGPRELAEKLVAEGSLEGCFLKQWHSFAQGRPAGDDDTAVIAAWQQQWQAGGRKVDQLLIEQMKGVQFTTKREPEGQE